MGIWMEGYVFRFLIMFLLFCFPAGDVDLLSVAIWSVSFFSSKGITNWRLTIRFIKMSLDFFLEVCFSFFCFPAWLCGFCGFCGLCGCVAFVALPCFTYLSICWSIPNLILSYLILPHFMLFYLVFILSYLVLSWFILFYLIYLTYLSTKSIKPI